MLYNRCKSSHSTKNFTKIGKPLKISNPNQIAKTKSGVKTARPLTKIEFLDPNCFWTWSTKKKNKADKRPWTNKNKFKIDKLILANNTKNNAIKFISCTVA